MRILDATVAEIRRDAERSGRWDSTHLWIVSDHGHSPVTAHDDLASLLRSWGHDTIAHPVDFLGRARRRRDGERQRDGAHSISSSIGAERPWWPSLAPRWSELVASLLDRPSVDLLVPSALAGSSAKCEVGRAEPQRSARDTTATATEPSPVTHSALDRTKRLSDAAAYDVTASSDYPDAHRPDRSPRERVPVR